MSTTARDVMTVDVRTVSPDMTLTELDRVLLAGGIGGAPVVEKDRLVGIVSRADIVNLLYDEQREASRVSDFYSSPFPIPVPALEHLARDSRKIADRMTKLKVREVMSADPVTVGPDEDVREVARLMNREAFHHVPVVEGDRLVGIVSSLDLVALVAEHGLAVH